ncbi:FtsB family cell division protein [Actinomyces vulturis]|uniref:FtsB family cell division protein n=1 Tax=Actinomyces vulturis TaxID=1857645 RepID=UPI00159ED9C5|nr:septum formation initiator family protein [Actinomyces vulturis]
MTHYEKRRDGVESHDESREQTQGAPKSNGGLNPSTKKSPTRTQPVLTVGGHDGMTVPWTSIALVVVGLFAIYVIFPSLRSYLIQQQQYDEVVSQVQSTKELNQSLENELQRWNDDDFVRSQARDRLGYVMPGETTYIVVNPGHMHGEPEAGSELSQQTHEPWFVQLNNTVQIAGQISDRHIQDPAQRGWTTPTPQVPSESPSPASENSP